MIIFLIIAVRIGLFVKTLIPCNSYMVKDKFIFCISSKHAFVNVLNSEPDWYKYNIEDQDTKNMKKYWEEDGINKNGGGPLLKQIKVENIPISVPIES